VHLLHNGLFWFWVLGMAEAGEREIGAKGPFSVLLDFELLQGVQLWVDENLVEHELVEVCSSAGVMLELGQGYRILFLWFFGFLVGFKSGGVSDQGHDFAVSVLLLVNGGFLDCHLFVNLEDVVSGQLSVSVEDAFIKVSGVFSDDLFWLCFYWDGLAQVLNV